MATSSDSLPPAQDERAEPVAPQRNAAEDTPTADPAEARAGAAGEALRVVAKDRPAVSPNPDRTEKLLALRRAIVDGTYTVDPKRVARRLADDL